MNEGFLEVLGFIIIFTFLYGYIDMLKAAATWNFDHLKGRHWVAYIPCVLLCVFGAALFVSGGVSTVFQNIVHYIFKSIKKRVRQWKN